jgi:ribonuclease E
VDNAETAKQIQEFAALVYPRRKKMVKKHLDPERSLFSRFNLTKQLETVFSRKTALPSGGELVFDQTEALMAVDINSGKISGESNFKEMALKTNLEAAEQIAQQLKLRDVGGQVVIDFIEMKDRKHSSEVEKQLKNALKNDKARTTVGRISRFGLLEMVRQRMGSSALSITLEDCPCCHGLGSVRSMEWRSTQVLKEIFWQLKSGKQTNPFEIAVEKDLMHYLLNQRREKLLEYEKMFSTRIVIKEV